MLYAIVQGIKFDLGKGIIESTYGRYTRALIHPSLITLLCRLVEVPMHESEEKFTHRLPMPLPKIKHGDADDMEVKDATKELEDDTEADEAPRDQQ